MFAYATKRCGRPMVLTVWLALVYAVACVVYLCITRFIPTPFDDSLTDAQRRIKAESASVRGTVFGVSVAVAVVLVSALFARHGGKM